MSELTKSLEIIAKHLSNAFLSIAADFRKLDTPTPLSQAEEKLKLVSSEPHTFTQRDIYRTGDLIMVMHDGGNCQYK